MPSRIARARASFARIGILLSWMVAALSLSSSPGSAALSNSAVLTSGQTTPDGTLTLIVVRSVTNGRISISLRNNGLRTIVLDTFSVRGASLLECSGRDFRIPSNLTRNICSIPGAVDDSYRLPTPQAISNLPVATPPPLRVTFPNASGASASPSATPSLRPTLRATLRTPEPMVGMASPEMALTWHELVRRAIAPAPSPPAYLLQSASPGN